MRSFEVTLTYKPLLVNQIISKSIMINKQKILEVELDEAVCNSPEEFCDAVINIQERPDVIRINIVEKYKSAVRPLYWLAENYGRIYFYNGIPIVLSRN
jgi:hypothetical protein